LIFLSIEYSRHSFLEPPFCGFPPSMKGDYGGFPTLIVSGCPIESYLRRSRLTQIGLRNS
jgi:hypothetical protein